MLSQHKQTGEWEISVLELKKRLSLIKKNGEEVYSEWPSFKNQVLEIAQREMSCHTDVSFTYKATKTGNKYTYLHFKIYEKPKQTNMFE